MNKWCLFYIEKYIAEHPRFTTEDLHGYLREVSPKNLPSRSTLSHSLLGHPLLTGQYQNPGMLWTRADVSESMGDMLRAIWCSGSRPMHELRREYGGAVDSAVKAGMILRAEEHGIVDYILTRRGMEYVKGALA